MPQLSRLVQKHGAQLARVVIASLFLQFHACAAAPPHETVPTINVGHTGKMALRGYDPVAYFRQGAAQKGKDAYQATWKNVVWKFVSEENKKAFLADPQKYAPSYGGYCAFAISRGLIADADPHCWAIVGDHLYLNNNSFAQHLWELNRAKGIEAGNKNWELTPKQPIAP
jgi:hypothetical protein